MMRKLILFVLAAGALTVAAQQPATAPPKPREAAHAAVEPLTIDDGVLTIRQLGVELAELRLQARALQRQAREWQVRALAAEAKLAAAKPPGEPQTAK